jgi:hypothetical protein
MRPTSVPARVAGLWAGASLLASLAGCFIPIPYGYPHVSYIPPAKVGGPPDEVHAFRVDINADHSCVDFCQGDRYTFRQVAVLPGGRTPAQTRVSCDYGFWWNCVALSYHKHLSHTARLRCYRPGYQTVELQPWGPGHEVVGKRAGDLAAQEQAVDDLVTTPGLGLCADIVMRQWREHWRVNQLSPGSSSAGHREALLFAAAEYDRLGLLAPAGDGDDEARVRLADKARHLRDLAEK